MHLLVVDQSNIRGSLLVSRLGQVGFRPHVVRSLGEAMASPSRNSATAVLLHQGAQPSSAAQLVKPMRDAGFVQPLIVLSDRDDWREKVDCLDAGADDFLVKPLRSEEIAARLRAVIRRSAGISTNRLYHCGIDLDLKQQCAWKDGRCLGLSRNEFRLLRLFFVSPDRPVTREDIRRALWAEMASTTENAIEVQVARLRKKLGEGSIRSLRGLGYILVGPNEVPPELPERARCRIGGCSPCGDGNIASEESSSGACLDSALYI